MLKGCFTSGHGKDRLQSLGFILTEDEPKHRTCILNTGFLLESQKLHHLLFHFQKQYFSIDTSKPLIC